MFIEDNAANIHRLFFVEYAYLLHSLFFYESYIYKNMSNVTI